MKPRFKKALRDLTANKMRTLLVTLAIAVGVFAFGSVFITNEILLGDMDIVYQKINPSTIDIGVRGGFGDGLISWAKQQEGVIDAKAITVNSVSIVDGDSEFPMSLITYDDLNYMQVNKIFPKQGVWPPGRGEVALERQAVSFLGINIGDIMTIELSNGQRKQLSVSSIIYDTKAIPPQFFPQYTGYISYETVRTFGLSDAYNRMLIITEPSLSEPSQIDKLAEELEARLEDRGVSVGSINTWPPNEHWAKENSRAFTTILSGIGVFSLLLSGFLVVNTISALVAQQKKQIGIMKAVGATSLVITTLYLATVLVYGVLALVIALPVGMVLAYFFLLAVTNFLNLEILNFHLPFRVFLMMTGVSLIVPVVASLIPLIRGTKVPVQIALSDRYEEKRTRNFIDNLVEKVKGFPRPLLLSIRNTFRNKARLALTLGTLSIAGMMFIAVVNTSSAMVRELDVALSFLNYDVQTFLTDNYEASTLISKVRSVDGVTEADVVIGTSGQRIATDGSSGSEFSVVGVDPRSDFLKPNLYSGRWLTQDDVRQAVVTRSLSKDDPQFSIGNNITIKINDEKENFDMVGVVLEAGGRQEDTLYVPFSTLTTILDQPGRASRINYRTVEHTSEFQNRTARRVEDVLKQSGINVATSFGIQSIKEGSATSFNFMTSFLLTMAVLIAFVGGLGLAGTMSLNVLERTREIGVVRSIGASSGSVRQIVVVEAITIAVLSFLMSLPFSVLATIAFGTAIGNAFFAKPLVFTYTLQGPLIWLLIVLTISVVASLLPARKAANLTIRETLAYE
ncbi:ABC transporter permease [Candidatus Woesebacteria bacterium]|nr:ABC transporter permease [Candidatus Woesebacteria bacterium]